MKIFVVDSFAKRSFEGNPAGVFIVSKDVSDAFLQKIAMEMNLSETAFVWAHGKNKTLKLENNFDLRWFTPEVEVNLCGHATLAVAKVLFEHYENMNEVLCFHTKSGKLYCERKDNKIEMKFPINEAEVITDEISFEKCSNLRDEEIVALAYNQDTKKLLVEIDSYDKLRGLLFDFNKLKGMIFPEPLRGLIITTKGDEKYDFYSRYFAPWVGVTEDPVTGSAHTVLYPYWRDKLNKQELFAKQISRRGGEIELYMKDEKVVLAGEAQIIMAGQFKGDIF